MTFNELVSLVAKDLNLSSPTALARIGEHINLKYRELLAKPWLQVSRRGEVRQPVTSGSRYVTFPNCTKIYAIYDPQQNDQTLGELSFDEMRNLLTPTGGPPQQYAIARQGSDTTQVFLDALLTTDGYMLVADAEQRVVTLSGDQEPKFSQDFHDILYHGAKKMELLKMEKGELAVESGAVWDQRISDLKYHIASSAYLNRFQGKDRQTSPVINTMIPG